MITGLWWLGSRRALLVTLHSICASLYVTIWQWTHDKACVYQTVWQICKQSRQPVRLRLPQWVVACALGTGSHWSPGWQDPQISTCVNVLTCHTSAPTAVSSQVDGLLLRYRMSAVSYGADGMLLTSQLCVHVSMQVSSWLLQHGSPGLRRPSSACAW